MNPAVVVPVLVIIMLLSWAIGFLSGVLWFIGRIDREKARIRRERV